MIRSWWSHPARKTGRGVIAHVALASFVDPGTEQHTGADRSPGLGYRIATG